jgi:predicted DNA-binding transcriptional regulator YafY
LEEYFNSQIQDNPNLIRVVAIFDKGRIRGEKLYGSVAQEDLGDKVRCEFLLDNLDYMSRWLLMFGDGVTVEQPEQLKQTMRELTQALYKHHNQNQFV